MRSVVTVMRCVLAYLLGAGTCVAAQDQIVGVGLAGAVRENGWVPLQVRLSSSGTPREVKVIGLGVTPDGDVLHTPQIVGVPPTSDVEVSVLALPASDASQVEVLVQDQNTTVRLVAPMPTRIPAASTVVLCLGPVPNGLGQLRDPDPRVRGFTSPVEVASLTDISELPSDWRALEAADVLVLPAEGLPAALGSVRWQALQRWVRELPAIQCGVGLIRCGVPTPSGSCERWSAQATLSLFWPIVAEALMFWIAAKHRFPGWGK